MMIIFYITVFFLFSCIDYRYTEISLGYPELFYLFIDRSRFFKLNCLLGQMNQSEPQTGCSAGFLTLEEVWEEN